MSELKKEWQPINTLMLESIRRLPAHLFNPHYLKGIELVTQKLQEDLTSTYPEWNLTIVYRRDDNFVTCKSKHFYIITFYKNLVKQFKLGIDLARKYETK